MTRALALTTLLAVAGAALAVGALAGAVNGAGSRAPASAIVTGYQSSGTIAGTDLERASRHRVARLGATAGPSAANKRPKLKLRYYTGVDFQTVVPGGAQLFEIRCPVKREHALTGGIFAPLPGLVVVNSSRTNPSADFPTRPRAWYEAVVNISDASLQWKPFVTCARRR